MPKKEKEEKTLQENLADPLWVNYHLLLKLEEIKKISFAQFEVLKANLELVRKHLEITDLQFQLLSQSLTKETEVKEERQGTFRNK